MIKKCPRCKSDQIITDAGCCTVCGSNISSEGQTRDEADQLDIVVTEVPEDDREFVGGSKSLSSGDQPDRGEQKPISKENKAKSDFEEAHKARARSYDPIGFSEPTLPPEPDNVIETEKSAGSKPVEKEKIAPLKSLSGSGQIKKLSAEEIKAIERNLYGRNVHLADKEKASIRSKINEIEIQAASLGSPHSKSEKGPLLSETLNPAGSEAAAAGRGKGVAYFYKNFIKLPGQQYLTKHDELLLNGKVYSLQPKKIKPTYVYAGAGVLFAMALVLVGSWFVKDATDGRGQIAGIVLDANERPYIKGAAVRFPDLGVTIKTNAQGLFTSDDLPAGSHRVEYLIDNRVVGSDHATVLDNGISMLALRPSTTKADQKKPIPTTAKTDNNSTSTTPSNVIETNTVPDKTATTAQQTKPDINTKQTTKIDPNAPGSIVLAANVDGAKFSLDGNVMGAGNLKYGPIKPGTYRYEVSAPGFKKYTGSITLGVGETETLEVQLLPQTDDTKQATYGAEDFFQSGVNNLKANKFEGAASDFTQALKLTPSYPQAYYDRGLAYQQLKKNSEAHDDFIKAAEIYKIKKEFSWAITSYNRALEINNLSIPALMGRAELYLAKGEEIAALTDFDAVLKIDKRNYQGYMGLGRARLQQGNYKLSLEAFKNARSINKDDPYLYQNLMLCYMSLNDFKEVKRNYDKFQELATASQKKEMATDKRFAAVIEMAKRQ